MSAAQPFLSMCVRTVTNRSVGLKWSRRKTETVEIAGLPVLPRGAASAPLLPLLGQQVEPQQPFRIDRNDSDRNDSNEDERT